MKDLSGKPAYDFTLPDTSGRMHRLADFRGSWLLMMFHRHLGWLPCRAHLAQLREHGEEFSRIGLKVVIVTFESDFFARSYEAENGLEWPLLVDRERQAYRYYDMLQASFWDLWGPSSWRAYLRELGRGGKLRPASDDIHQRGGDVLIDPEGIVRLHHVGEGPADRPSVETILARVVRDRGWMGRFTEPAILILLHALRCHKRRDPANCERELKQRRPLVELDLLSHQMEEEVTKWTRSRSGVS